MQYTVTNHSPHPAAGRDRRMAARTRSASRSAQQLPGVRRNRVVPGPGAALVEFSAEDIPAGAAQAVAQPQPPTVFEDWASGTYDNWTATGQPSAPTRPGRARFTTPRRFRTSRGSTWRTRSWAARTTRGDADEQAVYDHAALHQCAGRRRQPPRHNLHQPAGGRQGGPHRHRAQFGDAGVGDLERRQSTAASRPRSKSWTARAAAGATSWWIPSSSPTRRAPPAASAM